MGAPEEPTLLTVAALTATPVATMWTWSACVRSVVHAGAWWTMRFWPANAGSHHVLRRRVVLPLLLQPLPKPLVSDPSGSQV